MNKSCLIIKNDGIGDLVMVSGIISNIASFFPDGVDLVTCIQNKFIAEHIEGVRKIYFVSRDDLTYQSFRGANKLGIFLPKISTTDKAVLKSLKRKEYLHLLQRDLKLYQFSLLFFQKNF